MEEIKDLKQWLQENSDPKYREFSSRLMPNIDAQTVLGIRMPLLRQLAGRLNQTQKEQFMRELPHPWHEENLLHVLLLNEIKEDQKAWKEYLRLQPFIKTWALTDSLNLPALSDEVLLERSLDMLKSQDSYVRRQGVIWIMKRGLQKKNAAALALQALNIPCKEREVQLALAWMLCEGVCKNRKVFLPFLLEQDIDVQVLGTAVSKCRDSLRVSREDVRMLKAHLKDVKQKQQE